MGDEYTRRQSREQEEKLSLIEGAGNSGYGTDDEKVLPRKEKNDQHLIVALFVTSILICLGSIVVAFHANSMMARMEVVSTLGDSFAYGASLFAIYYVRGKDEALRAKIEFRTAVFSTLLLVCLGLKIAVMCYVQMRCAQDDEYHFHHIPCAYLQARPNAKWVLWMELGSLAMYGPAWYVGCFWTDMKDYSPGANINYASALLHAVVDVLSVVILAGSAGIMMAYPSADQYIDAVASLLVLLMLGGTSTLMWHHYFQRVRGEH